jgi:phosphatidylglycerol:prolipoprotein diacylglycerol transferase
MLPVLQVGSLAIPVPGLALLIGVWAALGLSEKEARRLQLDPDAIYTLAFTGLVAGLVGARLAYALHYWSVYSRDPLGILSLNATALAPGEGALIGVTAAVVYGARRQLPLRATLDALAPGVATMAVAVAVAHVASGDAFGALTALPWRVYLWGEYRHPSQIYELIGALLVLGVTWRTRARGLFPGSNFLLVVALSAAARIFLEAFRGDSLVLPGGWRAAQIVGLVVLAACLVAMRYWGREREQEAR